MTPKQMLEKRAQIIAEARAIYNAAEEEKRNVTADERQNFDTAMDEARQLKTDADNLTALDTEERSLSESEGRKTEMERADEGKASEERETPATTTFELRSSVCGDTRDVKICGETATQEYRDAYNRYLLTGEARALQKDLDTQGGYLSAPMQFNAELIRKVDDLVFMRQIGRVLPPISSAESLGTPSLDNDPADPTWVSELSAGVEDTEMSFGNRELKPHPLAQLIKVSKTLLRRSTIGPDAIVRDRLAYKTGIVQENGFLNGSGALQPLGLFTASNQGIPTSRDFSTGNTTTTMTFDGLKTVEYSLKGQYRAVASWIFHRNAVEQLAKLKDGEGRYIWQASVQMGQPDRLLNMGINESEYAPNTFTTGQYVGILGDYSKYWIVDALTLTIQVLMELYATTNQNGYLSRSETDGMPVLGEAFSRVKLA